MKLNNVFIESILYCPSQIYYYFQDEKEKRKWTIYIRQRGGPLTVELIETNEYFEWDYTSYREKIILSKPYDINSAGNLENEVIEEIEKEILEFLKQRFPETIFPELKKIKELDI